MGENHRDGIVHMACELYLCIGALSKTPYYLSGLGVNIYSCDELCYYLVQNAYILDNDLFDFKLCDFIRDNLELPELSELIRQMIRDKKTLGEMVTTLLTVTGYCDDEQIRRIRQVLVDNASLSFAAKRKVRGDNLLCANKYARAIEEYQFVLAGLNKDEEPELYSSILHNMGCAYAQMFLLEKAGDFFKKAYELDGDKESLIMFLICLRISSSKDEYNRVVVKNGYDERIALEAARRLSAAREADIDSPYADSMLAILDMHDAGAISEYYKAVGDVLDGWKADYRRGME